MALSATQTSIVQLVTTMFNAAPGKAILADLEALVTAGRTLEQIATDLTSTGVYKGLYPDTMTDNAFSVAFINNLVGSTLTDEMKAIAVEFTEGKLNSGLSREATIKSVSDALVAIDNADANFGKASATLENKIQSAANYSESLSSTDFAALQTVIAGVTDDALTIVPVPAVPGQSIVLKNTQDDLVGTDGTDTFRATSTTLQLGDNLDGGAGVDTLSIAVSGIASVLSGFSLKNIENVVIESNATTSPQIVDFSDADVSLATITSEDTEGASLVIRDLQNASIAVTIQDTDENHTVDYDEQALSGTADELKLTLNEVRTGATITANDGSADGNLETLSVTTTGIASSFVDLVSGTDLKTLNIAGDKDLTIVNTLDTAITTVDASTQTGKLSANVADTATDLTVKLGTNDDQVNFGDNLQTLDTVTGGTGNDTVSVNYSNTGNRSQTMSGVQTLNAVFLAAAEFDGTNVTDLETINLGLVHGSDDAAAVASTSNADFNDLKNTTKTVNVHHNQLDVELDFVAGSDTDLTVNGQTDTRAVTINGTGTNGINVINVGKLAINNVGDNALTVTDGVSLDAADTTAISLSTAKQGGDLTISDITGGVTSFLNGNAVESIDIVALDGDITATQDGLAAPAALTSFMDSAQALQTIAITSTNADVIVGMIGTAGVQAAADLESVTISNTNSASVDLGLITATGANINNVTITSSDKNTVASAGNGAVNIVVDGILTQNLDQLTVNAVDGGHVAIDRIAGTLDNYTVTGSGNVFITADSAVGTGLTMANIGTSTGYTGTVTITGGNDNDTLRGTAGADVIDASANGNNTIQGGLGNDTVTLGGGTDTLNFSGITAGVDHDDFIVNTFLVGTDVVQLDIDNTTAASLAGAATAVIEDEAVLATNLNNNVYDLAAALVQNTNGVDLVTLDGAVFVNAANADLDAAGVVDGSELLKGLVSVVGAGNKASGLTVDNANDMFYIAADDVASGYLYFASDVDGDSIIQADEIALIGDFAGATTFGDITIASVELIA